MRPEVRTFNFGNLAHADLYVDASYEGGQRGNAGDDPLNALLSVSNQGGFRYRGSLAELQLVVLISTLNDPDWPDAMDQETGVFTYYGDNKHPGRGLHETPRHGNEILRQLFDWAHSGAPGRSKVPPILVFSRAGRGRDVVFLGLAVPGSVDLRPSESLIAIWKSSRGRRFQNYRARLTILDVPVLERRWIKDVLNSNADSVNAPKPWSTWKETGRYTPLLANRSLSYRTKTEQIPQDSVSRRIIEIIYSLFSRDPFQFEKCAATIARMMLPNIASLDLTRPSRDGGRDGIGKYRIGTDAASILVDFALEAKCYSFSNSVGVREMSRLISRLRHRQFGVLVTTSYVDAQAYKEIKEDLHPIVVICAADIVDVLRINGLADTESVERWITSQFPDL